MLTTVDELAKYSIALDQNALLTSESYAHMTQRPRKKAVIHFANKYRSLYAAE